MERKMNLSTEQKSSMFDTIYLEYVLRHGLGGMAKTDLDTLIVYLLVKELNDINIFDLSNELKITESRIKSLLKRAAVKFDERTIDEAWIGLLKLFERVNYDIESLEKGQIRFQLSDPMLFRWLQEKVRSLGDTCTYSTSSEQITMNLDTLYKILDILWEDKKISDEWTGDRLNNVHTQIQNIIGKISEKIEKNMLEDLRERKQPKLEKNLDNAAKLVSIGSFIIPLIEKIK
jgi:hypothetical protein